MTQVSCAFFEDRNSRSNHKYAEKAIISIKMMYSIFASLVWPNE